MLESILDLLESWGAGGIVLSMFIEGSSLPFIGTFFIVTMGFIMDLTWLSMVWISLLGSLLYAIGSYIPYFIGFQLQDKLLVKLSPAMRGSLEKAKSAFLKYGIWSVALSSPLHLGNAVPFLAGMSQMNLRQYTGLTMLGIAPSTFVLLALGKLYPGDKEALLNLVADYQSIIFIGFAVIILLYAGVKGYALYKNKKYTAGEHPG